MCFCGSMVEHFHGKEGVASSILARSSIDKKHLKRRVSGVFYAYCQKTMCDYMLTGQKSQKMCEICSIDETMLPKLYESYEVTGTVKPEIAKELGFTDNVKVCAGAGDNAAAAVGTGVVGDGGCNISLGTSGTVFISSAKFGVDENNALHSFDHADGNFHLMGCMLSAASCNKWWMDEIIKTKDYAAEQTNINKLGENHVFFLT